eukprot:scaffold7368_cov143-Isochrysis_galbana.AAC.5
MTSPPPSPPGEEVEDEEGDHEEEDHGEEDQEEDPDSAPIIGYPYGPYTLYSPVAPEELGEENVVFELNTDGVSLYPPIEERADDVFEGDSESGRSVSHHTPSTCPLRLYPFSLFPVAARFAAISIFGPSFTPQVVPPSRSGMEGMRSGYAPFDANAYAFDRLQDAIDTLGRRTSQTENIVESLAATLQASIRHSEDKAARAEEAQKEREMERHHKMMEDLQRYLAPLSLAQHVTPKASYRPRSDARYVGSPSALRFYSPKASWSYA